MFPKTFSPVQIGPLELKNRLVMAPLTRQVAELDGTPTDEMAAYYARRARGGVGLIISEGTYEIDELGCKAYLSQPGIANDKHVEGWKKTTKAVHALGTPIICQLMHGGRVSDPRCLFENESAVSASDTQSEGWVLYTDTDDEIKVPLFDYLCQPVCFIVAAFPVVFFVLDCKLLIQKIQIRSCLLP